MPTAMYRHWLLARGVDTGSFTCCLGRRSKVSGRLEIWSSVRRLLASNPKQSREKSGQENPKHRQTHMLPAVAWPAQATKKPGSSARKKLGRTIPPETHEE